MLKKVSTTLLEQEKKVLDPEKDKGREVKFNRQNRRTVCAVGGWLCWYQSISYVRHPNRTAVNLWNLQHLFQLYVMCCLTQYVYSQSLIL